MLSMFLQIRLWGGIFDVNMCMSRKYRSWAGFGRHWANIAQLDVGDPKTEVRVALGGGGGRQKAIERGLIKIEGTAKLVLP